jgi:WD40 repeat protein
MSRCPSEQQLESLLEEQLGDAESRRLSAHVAVCERCQSLLERLTEAGEAAEEPSVVLPARATASSPSDTRLPVDFLLHLRETPPDRLGADAIPRGAMTALAAAAPMPAPPRVPGYEIIREIGRGGMGVVYQARHLGLNRLVALKMLRVGLATPKELVRFRHEAEAVARLHHPNIVQIYDIGESAGCPFLALEYVAGESLVHYLRGDPQGVFPAARLLETLALAIHFAHEHGIVHRDLKPANILLQNLSRKSDGDDADGSGSHVLRGDARIPKITDFGLAKRIDQQANSTDTGEVVGTPSYMAPEQAAGRGQPVGPAADVYALGAILYELLTGRPPFKGATALDTLLQVIHEEPVRPASLRPKLPRDLETICLKCLKKEPHKRYASAKELAEDLHRFRRGVPIEARPVGLRERAWKWARRRPMQAALLLGLVLVTVLGFAGVTWQWREAAAARDQALAEKLEKEEQKDEAEQARTAAEKAQQHAADQRRQARNALYYSRIAESQLQWRVNDFQSAEQTLAECLPEAGLVDRRGWEWYYLRGLYHTELFTLRHSAEGIGTAVDVRPDGRWIASIHGGHAPGEMGRDAEVRVWDARTGDLVHAWTVSGTLHRLVFSPDSKRIAFGGTDGVVLIRDSQTGEDLLRYQPHSDAVAGIAFSPDGKRVATAGWDGVVQLWDVDNNAALHTCKGHVGRVYHLAFHPDGRRVASAGADATVRLWDSHKGETLQVYRGHKTAVYSVAFSPDGELLVSAGSNGNLKLWEIASGRVTQSLTGQAGAALSVGFSPDGRYLAYGSGDTTVRVWDIESGVEQITFRGHTAPVDSVRFTPDGQRLVSGSAGQAAVKVWDLTRHPEFATLARAAADIEALAFRDSRRRLISITAAGKVQVWDAASGVVEQERTLPLTEKALTPGVLVSLSDDGTRVAARSRGDERVVRVWDVVAASELTALNGHDAPVTCVRLSGDGAHVATGAYSSGQNYQIKVWETAAGVAQATLLGKGPIFNLVFSPNGQYLATATEGSVAVVHWSQSRTLFEAAAHHGGVGGLTFSPDGQRLASAGLEDRTIKIWDWTAKAGKRGSKPALTLAAPAFVCDLAFSPDGRRLAGITRDLVKLWDAETGQEVLTLRGAPQRHYDPGFNPRLLFSPDGRRLVATNWDESISVWEADTQGGATALERRQAARRKAADQRAPSWHVQEAEHCLEHKNLPAARFHLQQLAGVALPEPLRLRRDRAADRLPKADE